MDALLYEESHEGRQEADGEDDGPSNPVQPEEPAAPVDVLQIELPLHSAARLVEVEALVARV